MNVTDHLIPVGQFTERVEITPSCWLWKMAKDRHGYGVIRIRGRLWRAHRVSYLLFAGPLTPSLEIDHLCRNRACVNPAHLELVTHRENDMRGASPAIVAHRENICQRGHPVTEASTRIDRNGWRQCRTCENERSRKRFAEDPEYASRKRARNNAAYRRRMATSA